jgi:serine/threonine-protein kinase
MHVCAECGERSEAPGLCPRDSQPLVLADDPLIGADLGRYRIARAIASGGMGRVYLGVQPEIGSRVAIKVLSEQCARDPELVERFFAEARAVNLIAHENIINVLDLATLDDGRPFIVMERRRRDATHATRAGAHRSVACARVRRCRRQCSVRDGIVHRDLADNIMITAKGHARVLDFGIAKLSAQPQFAGMRTQTGALLGTPAYMAPEQIASAGDVDARSDIYAVGAVLFHAVTGRPPFGGATMFDLMRAQLEELPPSPRIPSRSTARARARDHTCAREGSRGSLSVGGGDGCRARRRRGGPSRSSVVRSVAQDHADARARLEQGHAATARATRHASRDPRSTC